MHNCICRSELLLQLLSSHSTVRTNKVEYRFLVQKPQGLKLYNVIVIHYQIRSHFYVLFGKDL